MKNYIEAMNLISEICERLDNEKFEEFLELCSTEFNYRIIVYSPEIKKDMIWMDQDYSGMKNLLTLVPQHLRRLGSLSRYISIGKFEETKNCLKINSPFQIMHTDLNGITKLFAVGRYIDEIELRNQFLLKRRFVRLETRDLGIGSHIPL
ncbi:hydroxylase [Alphaproteobacteria bacterium]|nr:hydroxylase [Alphaproteobacteria bacterium]